MAKHALNDYPIHDLLQKRWSPRAFADRPVEPDKLRSLLEAARWAPSSFNEQPWAFLLATREQPEEFARVLGCLVEVNQGWAKAAPVLLLTVARLTFTLNQQPNRHAYHDVGLAVANLTVQAMAEGLFVHQMAGIVPAKARAEFHIPEGWDPVTAVAIGYLGDPATLPERLREREIAPPSRKPLKEFVFTGAWTTPAPLMGTGR
jgi:nitroreductase